MIALILVAVLSGPLAYWSMRRIREDLDREARIARLRALSNNRRQR